MKKIFYLTVLWHFVLFTVSYTQENCKSWKECFDKGLKESDINLQIDLFSRAINYCNKSQCKKNDISLIYQSRGESYLLNDDFGNALKDLNKSIELNPNDVDAYISRGKAYLYIYQYDKSLDDLNKALELDPVNSYAYSGIGSIYDRLGKTEKAVSNYTTAIKLNPDDYYSYVERGNCYDDLEQYDSAINDYSKAIKLYPDNEIIYYNRGNIYFKIKSYDKAINDFSKAITLNPEFALFYKIRGNLYNEIGYFDDALKDYNKYLELSPDADDISEIQSFINDIKNNPKYSSSNNSGNVNNASTYILATKANGIFSRLFLLRGKYIDHFNDSDYGIITILVFVVINFSQDDFIWNSDEWEIIISTKDNRLRAQVPMIKNGVLDVANFKVMSGSIHIESISFTGSFESNDINSINLRQKYDDSNKYREYPTQLISDDDINKLFNQFGLITLNQIDDFAKSQSDSSE